MKGEANVTTTDRMSSGVNAFLEAGAKRDRRTAEMAVDDINHIRAHLDELERSLQKFVEQGDSAYVMDARVCQRATRLEERVAGLRATIEARAQLRGYTGIE